MEAPESEMKRSTKRRRKKHPTSPAPDANTLFAVLLSALHHSSSSLVTIKRCLVQLRLSLTSQSPTPNPNPNPITVPILSLLPVLIKSKWAEIATRSIEIVGAASLVSFAMNERIALDGEIVKCLISALASPERSVSIAACNAILDLCTTTIGRQRLLEFSVIENIM
ncbi:hypothetical protein RJ639_015617 [Escallonia herrerae]|uniref:Uncharacterized protein n=1 Tax=Escallonia herrerae TaxID=1293975 RepID=A0AA88VEB5_9ASTE|nr:hypothetical protein RJ639_015617 [Escallonia herrerae]